METQRLPSDIEAPGRGYGVVAIPTSAGGLHALGEILSGLDSTFPVSILVMQHLSRTRDGIMAELLDRKTALGVKQAEDGETIVPGCVYTGPSNFHLLVNPDGTLSLTSTDLFIS